MANSAFVQIDTRAADRLIRKLATLGPRLETKYVAGAARKGVSVIGKEAGRNARKDKRTGALAKSMGAVTRRYKNGVVLAIAGPRSKKDPRTGENPANIAHLIEFPVKPHDITLERAKVFSNLKNLALGLDTKPFFTRLQTIRHPGFKGRPFMKPAFDSTHKQAQNVYADALRAALIKEALAP